MFRNLRWKNACPKQNTITIPNHLTKGQRGCTLMIYEHGAAANLEFWTCYEILNSIALLMKIINNSNCKCRALVQTCIKHHHT